MKTVTARNLWGVRHVASVCAVSIAIAFLINAVFGARSLTVIALEGKPIAEQIAWGISLALGVGAPFWIGSYLPIFSPLRKSSLEVVSRIDVSGLNPLWLSVLAGVGEEVLFRGAVQPIMGLWWTSLIFVLVHTRTYQFRSMNWYKAICAVAVFLASLFLGYICLSFGLIAAIVAHTTLDVVGLFLAQRMVRQYAIAT